MKLQQDFPIFPSICERDVNHILVEEFRCSSNFQDFFLMVLGIALRPDRENAEGVECFTEVCFSECEIDVLVQVGAAATKVGRSAQVFVENKIDSSFQPLQPERYREQAAAAVRARHVDTAKTVVVAPQRYLGSNAERVRLFDAAVSYEKIVGYLRSISHDNAEMRRRSTLRAALLEHGITKQKRQMPQIISSAVTLSWTEIYQVATTEFPDLRMPPPKEKGRSSWSIDLPCITRTEMLPKARLEYVLKKGDHVPTDGTVTILLPGLAQYLEVAKQLISPLMEMGMYLRKAGDSLGVTLAVNFVEPGKPFGPQRDKLMHGFGKAMKLRNWYEANCKALEQFARRYGPSK